MNPQVEAAVIAAVATIVGVGLTAVVALMGFRAAKQAAAAAIEAQRRQLDSTLKVQTLPARFEAAADMLGIDKPAPVRFAGVYAMAGLADDWIDNQQTCIDVLCGYLRMRYGPDPGNAEELLADQEVRRTIVRVIAAHLRADAAISWSGKDLDFTGVVVKGGDFSGAEFSGGTVNFSGAVFSGGTVKFTSAVFSGGTVNFDDTKFTGGTVNFDDAEFTGSNVYFRRADFHHGTVNFDNLSDNDRHPARFIRGTVDFGNAYFRGSEVNFDEAKFSGATVSFRGARFAAGTVSFGLAEFSSGWVDFRRAGFFSSATREAREPIALPGQEDRAICGAVNFNYAKFTGSEVDFRQGTPMGGKIDFRNVSAWNKPPQFDSSAEVLLPAESGETPS
jgi:uncharacterized protein YjbI with pentapeptide repeats